jgi:hypothetical protein
MKPHKYLEGKLRFPVELELIHPVTCLLATTVGSLCNTLLGMSLRSTDCTSCFSRDNLRFIVLSPPVNLTFKKYSGFSSRRPYALVTTWSCSGYFLPRKILLLTQNSIIRYYQRGQKQMKRVDRRIVTGALSP